MYHCQKSLENFTIKKLLRDGRRAEDIHDIWGLWVILESRSGSRMLEISEKVCYRTCVIIKPLRKEIPLRTMDNIAKPKLKGYQSLYMAVDVSEMARLDR
ncbi:LOW QUALITY PROTEIN: RelA/SpoT [Dillenia turbinata]|uniref:RelA/SpoT n=1 Tax=Dillenia turbinata TaxID=194707 RepID=A0AAN8VIF6_9MAGN